MARHKGFNCQMVNSSKGAQHTSASEIAARTTQEPAGTGRSFCKALRPVTHQLAGEEDGSVSIFQSQRHSIEKGEGLQGQVLPLRKRRVHRATIVY